MVPILQTHQKDLNAFSSCFGDHQPGQLAMHKHILRGVIGGVFMAAVAGALATVTFLLRGEAPFRALELSYARAMLIYLVTGAVGGALVGLSARWVKHRWVSATLGVIVATMLELILRTARGDIAVWARIDVIALVLYALLMGVPCGLILHAIFFERRNASVSQRDGESSPGGAP